MGSLVRRCEFSPCRAYRYTLWREWAHEELFRGPRSISFVMFVGLNPSTADETNDDPTIRRCIDFARRWGFGALCMMNLFAYRATQPQDMKAQPDPVGPKNDFWLKEAALGADLIIAAWGKHGAHRGRANAVLDMLPGVHCLRQNKDGSPEHPLYIPGETEPYEYFAA